MSADRICVMGLGYIGLPTASLLATKGYAVHGVDPKQGVAQKTGRGEVHIEEPSLDLMVRAAVQSGRLTAGTIPVAADVFILAVPTPNRPAPGGGDPAPDLSYVLAATEMVAPYLQRGNLVILESTSPVGTTEKVAERLAALRPDLALPSREEPEGRGAEQVFVAHCPERVLPGRILEELVGNDRIVGGIDGPSTERAVALYASFATGEIFATDSRTAEMAKLTENAFRDVNIAFANELSMICDEIGIDVWELIGLANRHPRVSILRPGPGVGGHCIAIDPWFIVAAAPETARLIKTARLVNDAKPARVIARVREAVAGGAQPTVACLGLAFKADVDDLRESPAVEITLELARQGVRVVAVEPHIAELPPALASAGVALLPLAEALASADVAVLLVDHREFRAMDRGLLAGKALIDTRGVWR